MKKILSVLLAVMLLAGLLPCAALAEDGSLKQEDAETVVDGMLSEETAEAPSAQLLADDFFRAVAGVESGTAGAELKKAQAVCGLYAFCFEHRLWLTDAEPLSENLLAALELLTTEEQAAYDINEVDICGEALRLLEPDEECGDAYADAGVADRLEALRADPDVCSGVELFLACVMTLGNDGEA